MFEINDFIKTMVLLFFFKLMTLFYFSEHIPKNQCQFHKYILYIRKTPDLNDLKLYTLD